MPKCTKPECKAWFCDCGIGREPCLRLKASIGLLNGWKCLCCMLIIVWCTIQTGKAPHKQGSKKVSHWIEKAQFNILFIKAYGHHWHWLLAFIGISDCSHKGDGELLSQNICQLHSQLLKYFSTFWWGVALHSLPVPHAVPEHRTNDDEDTVTYFQVMVEYNLERCLKLVLPLCTDCPHPSKSYRVGRCCKGFPVIYSIGFL